MLMKKNYGSSVNALCERHKSLNMKELIELHERVNLIMNSNSNTIHIKNGNQCFYDDDVQKQFYTKIGEAEQNFQMLPTNICDKELMQNTIVLSSSEEQNTHLKNQWQFIASGDTQKYPTLQTHEYKLRLEQNFGSFSKGGVLLTNVVHTIN
ncbi:hypothetical protein WH47_07890 [Habropoda laboriosa]|uniref:Uncharacterized protein n=1 Tax=Habropoda laboriosa TaxID=597456 RepID=A0A0L7RFU9_9HYME|nr:hypothetical protein WH47_07890 [Habropoda laboriosa]